MSPFYYCNAMNNRIGDVSSFRIQRLKAGFHCLDTCMSNYEDYFKTQPLFWLSTDLHLPVDSHGISYIVHAISLQIVMMIVFCLFWNQVQPKVALKLRYIK